MQELQAAFRSLSSTVSGYIHIHPVINEACEDSSKATPGYLYKEIAEMTFESTDTCMKILELLCEKMEVTSPIVKYKALNVVKNVLQKGSPAFFREMGRKHMVIRDCLNFRGPPDPLHGDAPYSQVRDLAQQVINMIYDTQPNYNDSTVSSNPYALSAANASRGSLEHTTLSPPSIVSSASYSSQTTSLSSNGAPSSNYRVSTTVTGTTSDGGRRVFVNSPKAIGSYVEYQPSRFETMLDAVSEGIDSFKASLVGPNTNKDRSSSTSRGYVYGAGSSTSAAPNLTYTPNFTTGDVSSLDHQGGGDLSNWTAQSDSPSPVVSSIPGISKPISSIIDGWEYKWVAQLTPATGRPSPPRNDISDFVSKATQLANSNALNPLVEALFVRILVPDYAWQCKLKALHLLEAILRAQVGNAVSLTKPILSSLVQLSQVSIQSAIHEKVTSIINCYPQNERPVTSSSSQSPLPTAVHMDSITASPSQNGNSSDSEANGGLFSGLDDRTESSTPAPTPSLLGDDFSFLSSSSASPALSHVALSPQNPSFPSSHPAINHGMPDSSSASGSLFDGLELDQASSSGASSTFAPKPTPQDLLVDFSQHSQYTSPHPATNGNSSPLSNLPPLNPVTAPVIVNRNLTSGGSSELERDFFSRPALVATSDPTATLRQLQPTSTIVPSPLHTSGRDVLDQLAILKGQRAAVSDQIQLVEMQMPSATRTAMEIQLLTHLQNLDLQIQALDTASRSKTTSLTSSSSPSMSLEALYRQQPTNNGTTSIDYKTLQTSHPVDPFDAMRHEIRR
jgi:hypothetical protein